MRLRRAEVLILTLTFLPSIVRVLDCKLGFHTRLVWRWEKLTLLPCCLPFLSKSSLCMIQGPILQIETEKSNISYT